MLYPIDKFICHHNFPGSHIAFLAALGTDQEPINFKEAMRNEHWHKAMAKEIHALEENGTWSIIDLSDDK